MTNGALAGSPFDVSWQDVAGTRTVVVSGEVDLSVADELSDALDFSRLVVDMSGVTFIDSSGVRCLLNAREACDSLQLTRSARVDRILVLTGVSDLFPPVE